jgi:hypothetical protein
MQRARLLAAFCAAVVFAMPAAALTQKQIDQGARKASHGLRQPVRFLASDKLQGRQNGSEGSVRAQEFLVKKLRKIAEPLGTGDEPYLQPFLRLGDVGTNVVAVIRGSELPEEYVMIGGHYDHLGTDCDPGEKPGDVICNGATDNAAGTAAVLAVAKAIAKLPEPPRRSVVIALWDAEEDGLEGAEYYVEEAPLVPLAQTVAYVNLDLLGATLIPSLARNTFAIGSETGGAVLRDAIDAAAALHPAVELTPLSEAFGQGRSDYRPFALAGVPTVFFGDGSSACYHTAGDDLSRVDWKKLAQQSAIAFRTVLALTEGATAPVFAPPNAAPVYEDTLELQRVLALAVPADLPLFSPEAQAKLQFGADVIDQIADDGPAEFDAADAGSTLIQAGIFVTELEALPCPGW